MSYKPTHANATFTKFGAPEVDKLYNDRYRIVVRCNVKGVDSKWHWSNVANFWKDFGSLYETPLQIDGADTGWEPASGEVYPNMRLVQVNQNYPRTPNDGAPVVEFTYETLTAAYVQDADEKVDYELNGLRRVTRTVIASEDTSYGNTVGSSTIAHTSRGYASLTLTLASAVEVAKRENEGGSTKFQEVWVESGELSRSDDAESGNEAISITNIGACPSAPSGYTAVKTEQNNTQGFPTCSVTFYKNNAVLSRSNDYVGSQLAEMVEVFKPSTQPTPTNGGSLANKAVSNVDGIPTTRYTFLVSSILSQSEDKVGSQLAIVIEAFSETPATPSGYSLARTDVSNVEGIPTLRYTFLKPSILTLSTPLVGGQQRVTVSAFSLTSSQVDTLLSEVTANHKLIDESVSDYEGIKTSQYTFEVDDFEVRQRTESGLLQATQTELSASNFTDSTIGVVGAGDYLALYRAGEEIDNGNTIKKRISRWAEAGEVQTSTKPGRVDGTTEVTIVSTGVQVIPTGVVIATSQTDKQGYSTFTTTAVQGTITGVKQTYTDVIDVEVPGTVNCTTENVSISDGTIGNISGTIAIPKVQPRRSKKIAATVTVEITTTPPNTTSLAYDLGEVSCSVTSIGKNYSSRNGPTKYSKVGIFITPYTDWQRSYSPSARIQVYPGCYLTNAASSGSVSYTSGTTYVLNADEDDDGYGDGLDTTIVSNAFSGTECVGTGSTAATGYLTSGILKRNSRPIINALDGSTYYEVITWSI